MRTRVIIAFVTLIGIVGLFLGGLAIGRSTAPPSPAVNRLALAPAGADCWELLKNATRVFEDGCGGTPPPSPTPTTPPPSPTPPPTATPTPTGGPTATPMPPGDHDRTSWHEPGPDASHHHGVNPRDYVDIFGPALEEYLNTYGEISYPWQTDNENVLKHEGYIWLYTKAAGGCEFGGLSAANCVTDVLVQVHSLGTPAAVLVRNHSFVAFARICTTDGSQCGVVMTGGWHDYGFLHCPYKGTHCALDSDPQPPEGEELPDWAAVLMHQQPYRTTQARPGPMPAEAVQFWAASLPNPIIAYLYPHQPNYRFEIVWSSHDAWGNIPEGDTHGGYIFCPDGSCDLNHSRFQLFTAYLREIPAGGSDGFTGWTNRWGHLVEGCETAGRDCVPFVVSAGTPGGDALLQRTPHHGDCNEAPCMDFDSPWLRPSTYEHPHPAVNDAPEAYPAMIPTVEPYP